MLKDPENILISVEKLVKQYAVESTEMPMVDALISISFKVFAGDKIGLIGLNGSGKSTLLNIISGHLKPTSGRVVLYEEVSALSHFDSMLHPDLNGTENIDLQLRMLGISNSERETTMKEIVDFSGLEKFIDRPVKTYSSGMMLRLSFSIFKAVKPQILLLDEVFSAGDMIFRKKADELLKNHLSNASCIIMASHELQEIAKYCNRCIVLNKGKIVFDGSVDDAIDRYIESNENQEKKLPTKCAEMEFLNARFLDEKSTYRIRESITVSIRYIKKAESIVDLVVYINNQFGQVLTDCNIYREDFEQQEELPGNYELSFTIPKHLLNVGRYSVDLAFGNREHHLVVVESALKFEVIPDEWEKERLWNQNPTVPVRPHFIWNKKKIE